MNPKLAKFLVKQIIGAIFTYAIGYAIKCEKNIDDRIDDHYAKPKSDQENN